MTMATNAQVSMSIAVTIGTTGEWIIEKNECFVVSNLGNLQFSKGNPTESLCQSFRFKKSLLLFD